MRPEDKAEPVCPYVTGTVTRYCTLTPFTLTDEEREAIVWAAEMLEAGSLPQSAHADDAAKLRGLLERVDSVHKSYQK
jgi:predicted DNA-binding transcriptional regulator YafY